MKSNIEALAIELYLKYCKEILPPWGQLWPDQKEQWLKASEDIINSLKDCGFYLTKERS